MNIFILDEDPTKAAQYHHSVHLNKMLTEACQIACSVVWHYDPETAQKYYDEGMFFRKTHINHPWCAWAREDRFNYSYVLTFISALAEEWEYRRGKSHGSYLKCFPNLSLWEYFEAYRYMEDAQQTPFPLCMPDKYKQDDPVASYRHYYACEKMFDKNEKSLMDWSPREKPYWILGYEV